MMNPESYVLRGGTIRRPVIGLEVDEELEGRLEVEDMAIRVIM